MFEEFTIALKYQVKVDTDTGEMTTKCISRKIDKSNFEVSENKKTIIKNDTSEPMLYLDSNKFTLNQSAINLTGFNPENKITIEYGNIDGNIIPLLKIDEKSGNRLTKSHTVSYRGNKNKTLSEYGSEFKLEKHPELDNIFILKSDKEPIKETGNEDVNLNDLEELIEPDSLNSVVNDTTEVNNNLFQF